MNLRGATCLITGATSGIGRAAALRLAEAGAIVLALGRDERALEEVAARTGGRAIRIDLAEPEAPELAAGQALAALRRVDVLVNNAGEGWAGRFWEMPPERAHELVRINLLAPIRLTRGLLPQMLKRRGGHVVNVASIAGHVGVGRESVYAATKAGLIAFSESLRQELAGSGVRVSVISPGPVNTPFFERRGRPYERWFPRPIDADRVARSIVRAIRRNKAQVFVPGWLSVAAWVRGTWPQAYRYLAGRLG